MLISCTMCTIFPLSEGDLVVTIYLKLLIQLCCHLARSKEPSNSLSDSMNKKLVVPWFQVPSHYRFHLQTIKLLL
jgi:hypothetical protein